MNNHAMFDSLRLKTQRLHDFHVRRRDLWASEVNDLRLALQMPMDSFTREKLRQQEDNARTCFNEHVQLVIDSSDLLALLHEDAPQIGNWKNADDIDRLVRELDIALNGLGAASQARLCDIVSQVKSNKYILVRKEPS